MLVRWDAQHEFAAAAIRAAVQPAVGIHGNPLAGMLSHVGRALDGLQGGQETGYPHIRGTLKRTATWFTL